MAWHTSATFSPGELHDEYYMPQSGPPLMAPEPQRVDPGMASHIADGIQNMSLDRSYSAMSMSQPREQPNLSPFPKLTNPPPNCPPSDDELEARLENARQPVLNSNDPEMQLAWAQDALTYCGVAADEAERLAAAKPQQARPATPRVEHQLKQDAMNIVTFLADQHHPRAEFLRGMWLEWGRFGQREDKKEAFRCYSRAADRGYVRAEYRIGMLYESYNDPAKALRHYHRGVDAGDAASCYRLGMMTLRGQHGQQQDYKRGVELIKQSAAGCDENAAQGAYVYGMLLAKQLPQVDVPDSLLQYDEQLARENIQKAAFMKFAKAQAKMGSNYELGALGCDFNPALSMHYNALASKQGEADADMALSKWFLVGADKIFPKNEELAYVYAERAAQTGLPTAEFALGYFNEIGMYVPVSLDSARDWYAKAAKHGNGDAQGRLDGLAKKQVLSKKDHENVAISRIKSQYGSMKGQRPDRFRQKQQPGLGNVDESPAGYNAVQPPLRGTTPYPEGNGPPRIPPLDPRPGSAAPYPLEDTAPRLGGGPAGGFFNVQPEPRRPATTVYPGSGGYGQDRPSSAFSIQAPLEPRAHSTVGVPQGARPYPGSGPGMRPQTSQPYDQRHVSAPGQQRPLHLNDPRARPNVGGRVASGPAGMGGIGGGMQPAPLRPAPGPGSLSHTSTAPPPSQPTPLGFIAPIEDRPPVVDPTWNAEKPSRRRMNGATTPNFDSSPRPGPDPGSVVSNGSNASSATLPSSGPSSRPGSTKPPGTPNLGGSAAAPGKKPAAIPGKGPKTFEEMGVPAHNQDKECVSRSYLDSNDLSPLTNVHFAGYYVIPEWTKHRRSGCLALFSSIPFFFSITTRHSKASRQATERLFLFM